MGCGTILQLVAYGAQDIYLSGNPQITFFKAVYKRYTNFGLEVIEENFINPLQITQESTSTVKCKLSKVGDLLKDVFLEIDIIKPVPDDILNDRIGLAIIDNISLEIGGVVIDRLRGEWIDIYFQKVLNKDKYTKLKRMIDGSLINNYFNNCESNTHTRHIKLYIPLPFYFTKNIGLALPIMSLEYNEVSINVTFKNDISMVTNSNLITTRPVIQNVVLLCEYIYLDTKERKLFYELCHEYLIEQVQYSGKYIYSKHDPVTNINLRFNSPIKELIWLAQDEENLKKTSYFPFCYIGDNNYEIISECDIILNGVKRFKKRLANYFRVVQPFQHNEGSYCNYKGNNINETRLVQRGWYYNYSFAIFPDNFQPSGTCNFSRIDTAVLSLNINNQTVGGKSAFTTYDGNFFIKVYAVNYNVLKFESGMGYLVFTN